MMTPSLNRPGEPAIKHDGECFRMATMGVNKSYDPTIP